MFTGIVEELSEIRTIKEDIIEIESHKILDGVQIGDSIAVNGVCLTVTELMENCFEANISPETFSVTALKKAKSGTLVNLERAMPANGRFGGHIVSGHIDGIGKVVKCTKQKEFYELEIELTDKEIKYVVKKGSIAINGISLTIAEIVGNKIKIAVIPHTYNNTNLKELKIGDFVNIEVDILAKYIEKFLSTRDNSSGISINFLQENGFC